MLQSHTIRNPFTLLQDDNSISNLQIKLEKQKIQWKPIKKLSNMPFAKFQIKHQIKNIKTQLNSNKQIKLKQKSSQKQINEQKTSLISKQESKQIIDARQLNNDSQSKNLQIGLFEFHKSQTMTQSQYTDDDQQKKYFLTKKHRQIKYELNSDGDPPLLYDIGLDAQMIKDKLKLVLKMGEPDYDMIMNPDLAGPVMIAFSFGFLLLFSGQMHFGDIYALFIIGNIFLFMLFNFMARKGVISLYNIMSILGYCLLPMLILGVVGIFTKLNTGFGLIFSLVISSWSSIAGGNFIQALTKGKRNRKMLIIYPLFLFYANFAMIVIF